jgi:hypothetical protein
MIDTIRGQAVVAYGSYLQVRDPDSREWLDIMGLAGFSGPNVTRGEIDTTRLDSKAKEYVLDLKDNGTFTSTMQTLLGSRSQQILARNLDSPNTLEFRLHLPDDGFGNGEVICGFEARVSGFPISGSQGQVITTELSLRITGDLDWIFPDSNAPRLTWSTHTLNEYSDNEGRVAGIVSVIVWGDTFEGDDGEPLEGVSFQNIPVGLTPEVVKVSDSTAYIGFSGKATAHEAGDSGAVLVTFNDDAFVGGKAAKIANTQNQVIFINFHDQQG